jgi:hypothetical protein
MQVFVANFEFDKIWCFHVLVGDKPSSPPKSLEWAFPLRAFESSILDIGDESFEMHQIWGEQWCSCRVPDFGAVLGSNLGWSQSVFLCP